MPLASRLLVLVLAAVAPAAAQSPLAPQLRVAVDTPPRPVAPAEPEAIPPIDIPLRATSALARLSEIQALVTPVRSLADIERSAPLVLDSVTALSGAQLRIPAPQMTRRALGDLNAEWDRWAERIEQWTRVLRTRTAALDSARREMAEGRRLWVRTIQRARAEGAPEDVIAQAAQVRDALQEQDAAVLGRLQQLVEVEVALTRARLTVDAGRAALDEAMSRERAQLFRADSPPFWAVLGSELPPLRATVRERWETGVGALRVFWDSDRGRMAFHLLLAVALLAAILALRRGAGWPDGAEAQGVSRPERWLLDHPFASTLLMALVLIAAFYPRAPSIVYDVALLAAAAPLFRVMPSLLASDLQRFGRAITVLFVADRLVTMFLHTTPWHRVGSLAVALLALGIGAAAVGRFHRLDAAVRRRPTVRWPYRGALLAVAVAGTAVLANLIGNATLAVVLTSGVSTLAYVGILLYAATQVAGGLVSVAARVLADDLHVVERHGPVIAARAAQLVRILAVVAWLSLALFLFYLWDPVRGALTDLLAASWTLGKARISLAGLLLFFVTVWVGALLGRWIAIVLEADVLDRLDLPRGVPVTIASVVRYALTAAAFFIALAAIGADISQLAIIGGALSVGVGFGLQTIVNNFISGLILAFERPLAVGDVIRLGELEGEVRQIGIRASVLRTFQGADVIVPNAHLIANEVINWTRSDTTRRLEVAVGVAYGTDPAGVVSLLAEVAAGHPQVRPLPAPFCLFQGFGESSLDFVLRFWTDVPDFPRVQSDVRLAVHQALQAAGIEIPFPQRDVHVRTLPPTQGAS